MHTLHSGVISTGYALKVILFIHRMDVFFFHIKMKTANRGSTPPPPPPLTSEM